MFVLVYFGLPNTSKKYGVMLALPFSPSRRHTQCTQHRSRRFVECYTKVYTAPVRNLRAFFRRCCEHNYEPAHLIQSPPMWFLLHPSFHSGGAVSDEATTCPPNPTSTGREADVSLHSEAQLLFARDCGYLWVWM